VEGIRELLFIEEGKHSVLPSFRLLD